MMFLWHWWYTCFEHVWFLKIVANNWSTLLVVWNWENVALVAFWEICHIWSPCDPLHRVHCSCIPTLQYTGLLTLTPSDSNDLGVAINILDVFTFWSNSNALHLVSKNVTSSAVVGVSAREVVFNSHSRWFLEYNVASIKWFNIKSWTGTFKDSACNAFMWLYTWLTNWCSDDASPLFTQGIWHKCLAWIMAISLILLYHCVTSCQATEKIFIGYL
jgi:hypothetical protein